MQAHSRNDDVRDGEAFLEGEFGGLDDVVRVERGAGGPLGSGLAFGELLNAVKVDREDTGAVVCKESGKRATDNLGAELLVVSKTLGDCQNCRRTD